MKAALWLALTAGIAQAETAVLFKDVSRLIRIDQQGKPVDTSVVRLTFETQASGCDKAEDYDVAVKSESDRLQTLEIRFSPRPHGCKDLPRPVTFTISTKGLDPTKAVRVLNPLLVKSAFSTTEEGTTGP